MVARAAKKTSPIGVVAKCSSGEGWKLVPKVPLQRCKWSTFIFGSIETSELGVANECQFYARDVTETCDPDHILCVRRHIIGQNPVPPVNIPIPTKIGSKMGGAPTPKWYWF